MRTCSAISRELGEPLTGTAPVARAWLVLEQPGPWGRTAATQSHLDPAVGAELEARLAGSGVRLLLMRRPGHHADLRVRRPRHVLLASTVPGAAWVEQGVVDDPKDLLGLDMPALVAGGPPGFGDRRHDPVVLVCTNARRDRCCALAGRALANELAAGDPEGVWECTHLGGHRFAPTALVLPHGLVYGRLTAALAAEAVAAAAAGQVLTTGYRGRSTWDRAGQAAEAAVREQTGDRAADALTVVAGELAGPTGELAGDSAAVTVAHADGRRWQVLVDRVLPARPRPESCGKEPGRPDSYVARAVRPA